jgi:hypothetical protein
LNGAIKMSTSALLSMNSSMDDLLIRTRRAAKGSVLVMGALAAIVGGCNSRTAGYPPLGDVTGRVTEGGRPVANVTVVFQPAAGGRASTATTDSSGRYSLRYTDVAWGAMVGMHEVSLAGAVSTAEPQETLQSQTGSGQRHSFTVQPGKNTFDIEIIGK